MPEPIDTTTAATVTNRGTIRWWEPLFVLGIACLGWLIFLFGSALVVGLLLRVLGYGRQVLPHITTASTSFFALQAYFATFYLAVLLVMRFLAKRRGRALFALYFPSIGLRPVLHAALSGFGLAAIYLMVILGLSWTSVLRIYPTIREAAALSHSLGRLAISALVSVVLAPLTEEIYFRGLLLDCLQQKFVPLLAALITAVVFSLVHGQFLLQPGIVGWLATIALAALGLLNALWVQRTHSLRAPIAAHASYNATLVLFVFLVR